MPYKDPEKRKQYHREYNRKWREKEENLLYQRWYQREYYKKNREKILAGQTKNRGKAENRYQLRARRYHRFKIQALKMYGGEEPKCAWCGENRYECLQIDHINDDGYKDRRIAKSSIGGGENFFRWLIKQPHQPDKYQVLCANCNVVKRLRGVVSYNQGFKTIKEWEKWAKHREVLTPKEIKKLWLKKRQQRLKEKSDS